MFSRMPQHLRGVAIGSAATIAIILVGALLFAASGVYNIAASRGHFAVTEWLLEFGMRRSVATHSLWIAVPALDDPDLIRLGAGHYHGGCAQCHAAPGEPQNPIVASMLPPPPDLMKAVPTWSPAELFWIVKHGLKYTGMPAWSAQRRGDEVWAVVAFLQQLPGMEASRYRALATGNANLRQQRTAHDLVRSGNARVAISMCARCHGDGSAGPTSGLVPRLAGQSERYLEMALRQYADGSRPSGVMQPVAVELDDDTIIQISKYYSDLSAFSATASDREPSGQIARGRSIATEGVPASGIPPCLACHAGNSAATFPRLAGQHAMYIVRQLHLFRDGVRTGTTHAAIMAPIARRLSEPQMQDVAAYFESRAAESHSVIRHDAVESATGRMP
jgi:cytochrome c553